MLLTWLALAAMLAGVEALYANQAGQWDWFGRMPRRALREQLIHL